MGSPYGSHPSSQGDSPVLCARYSAGVFFSCSSARHSWSGHDVPFMPQRMPSSRGSTSSMCWPRTNWLMPCRLPLQPPIKNTCCMTLFSSAVTSITFEHVPFVSYIMCFVFIFFLFFVRVFTNYQSARLALASILFSILSSRAGKKSMPVRRSMSSTLWTASDMGCFLPSLR